MAATACAAAYLAIAYTAFRMFDRTERRIFAWHFACLIDTMLFVHWMVTFITSKPYFPSLFFLLLTLNFRSVYAERQGLQTLV